MNQHNSKKCLYTINFKPPTYQKALTVNFSTTTDLDEIWISRLRAAFDDNVDFLEDSFPERSLAVSLGISTVFSRDFCTLGSSRFFLGISNALGSSIYRFLGISSDFSRVF